MPRLERIRELLHRLGNPDQSYGTIIIAGTNGKTSTATISAAILSAHGYKTGLFTSPHIFSPAERFKIDDQNISAEDFLRIYNYIMPVLEEYEEEFGFDDEGNFTTFSFFEVMTVMALFYFWTQRVHYAVLEVGLGGRLDATNVVDAEVGIITPVDYDHMQWLGSSLEEIAYAKAGIIKRRADGSAMPVVVGKQHDEVRFIIETEATEVGANLLVQQTGAEITLEGAKICESGEYDVEYDAAEYDAFEQLGADELQSAGRIAVMDLKRAVGGQMFTAVTPHARYTDLFLPLYGTHQASNALLAITAVEQVLISGGADAGVEVEQISIEAVQEALSELKILSRFEVVRSGAGKPTIIYDMSHNLAAGRAFTETVLQNFDASPKIAILSIMQDKDAEGYIALLHNAFDKIIVTTSGLPRAHTVPELKTDALEYFDAEDVHTADSIPEALKLAEKLAQSEGHSEGLIAITGSSYNFS